MRGKGFLTKQAEFLLQSKQRTLLCAAVLAVLPYCAWLAMTIVALVTLRKGEREGGQLLVWVMFAHAMMSAIASPLFLVVVNTVIFFVPCYVAACILRMSASWQAVAGVLFLQVIMSALLIQAFAPEWVVSQYAMIQSIFKSTQPDHALTKWLNDPTSVSELVMANYAFGIQLMSAVMSVLVAVVMARSIQSRLYYPGAFAREMLMFRGNKLSFIVIIILGMAAWHLNMVAMNVLPVLALFYMMAGLSLCASVIVGKTARLTLLLLVVPLMFIPFVMGPLYIIVGLLDSVFNLRLVFAVK